jgi:carbonic anhydrase
MLASVRAQSDPSYFVNLMETLNYFLDIARALGLEEGDAHVIRNAGGRASDALRSIVISQQLLGTREIVIVHHVRKLFDFRTRESNLTHIIRQTDCGMLTFTDDVIRGKIRLELRQNADHIAFLPFGDLKQSVLDDIQVLKESPLVLDVPITGYIYEVESGKIVKIGSSQ